MEALLDELDNIGDEVSSGSSGEDPSSLSSESSFESEEEIVEGIGLVGKTVFVVFDKEEWKGKIMQYNKIQDLYAVTFEKDKKNYKDIKFKELIFDQNDWRKGLSPHFRPIKMLSPKHEHVNNEYDRIRINGFRNLSPLQIFYSFISKKYWQSVVTESNNYAKLKSIDLNLDLPELFLFIALCLVWGIYSNFPAISYFWNRHWVFDTSQVKKIMTRQRFLKIGR